MSNFRQKRVRSDDLKKRSPLNDKRFLENWMNEKKGIKKLIRQLVVKFIENGELILLGAFINLFVDLAFILIHIKWFEISTSATKETIFSGDFRGNALLGISIFTGIIMGTSFIAVEARSSEMAVAFFKKAVVILTSFSIGGLILVIPWHDNYWLFISMCILTLIGSCLIAQIIITLIRNTVSYVKSPVDNEAVLKKMNFIWIIIAAIIGWMLKK